MPYKNHEDLLAAKARYRERHRERLREWMRDYQSRNRKKPVKSKRASAAVRAARYAEKVVEYRDAYNKSRGARKRGATGKSDIKPGDLKRLLAKQGGLCAKCSVVLDETKHLDHILPIARGGAHLLSNVQWLCMPCNTRKGART